MAKTGKQEKIDKSGEIELIDGEIVPELANIIGEYRMMCAGM